MFIGFGTVINVVTVAIGSTVGLLLGNRMAGRMRLLVTQTMGLLTIVLGGLSLATITSPELVAAAGDAVVVVLVLGLVIGALVGSGLRVEDRLEDFAEAVKLRLGHTAGSASFTEGLITATLVFCVGPLTILGSLNDGLGLGSEQLIVKSILDGFFSIALASSLGVGVLFSAVMVGIIQGSLTGLGWAAGDVIPLAQIDGLTIAGGVILLALGLRISGILKIAVADLLPALAVTPLLVWLVSIA